MKSRKPLYASIVHCLAAGVMVLGLSTAAWAETYVGLGVGASFAGDFENTRISDTTNNLFMTASDLEGDASTAYGVRLGHYFSFMPWLGVEFQWFRRAPDADTQTLTLTGTATAGPFATPGTGTGQIVMDNLDTYAFMVNVRGTSDMFPSLGNLSPYLGMGLALNSIDIESFNTNITSTTPAVTGSGFDSDTDASFLVQVGSDYRLTERLNAYAEYKYTPANFTFNQLTSGFVTETDFADHTFMLGLKYTLFE